MSNSGTANGLNSNCGVAVGTRDGTRVVLREITATLQNSPPMHLGLRKVANNSQPGKTEHEVKVQFTREFVDAGAPNSRPESLSSASSFQSLASTLSAKSVAQSAPLTPQRAADTSYVSAEIPGLDDLIAACGNIRLNDKVDLEESTVFKSLPDYSIDVAAAGNNPFQLPNIGSNSIHEEVYGSVINDSSYLLNGTQDLSLDYKEANEYSVNLEDTRDVAILDKSDNSNSDLVRDSSLKQTSVASLVTNHVEDPPDIPQLIIDDFELNETSELSLKLDSLSLNRTVDLENNKSLELSSASLNSSVNQNSLNDIKELGANCNSTFNNINSSKSEIQLNITQDILTDNLNVSTHCDSQCAIDTNGNQSLDKLSINEEKGNISLSVDSLNLPSESDVPVKQDLPESCAVEEPLDTELALQIETPAKTNIEQHLTALNNNPSESYVIEEPLDLESALPTETSAETSIVHFPSSNEKAPESCAIKEPLNIESALRTEVQAETNIVQHISAPHSDLPESCVFVERLDSELSLQIETSTETNIVEHHLSSNGKLPYECSLNEQPFDTESARLIETPADINITQEFLSSNSKPPESCAIEEPLNAESALPIETSAEINIVQHFEAESTEQNREVISEQCTPELLTDQSTNRVPQVSNPSATVNLSSVIPEVHQNTSTDFPKESTVSEEDEQTINNLKSSTTTAISEKQVTRIENLQESEPQPVEVIREAIEVKHEVISPLPVVADPETEDPPRESSVVEPQATSPLKPDNFGQFPPVSEIFTPCIPQQNLLNQSHVLEEYKAEERVEKVINLTPFPGYGSETLEITKLNLEEKSQNESETPQEDSSETIIAKEESFHSLDSESASETFYAFQPQKQSTTLKADSNFTKLEIAAQVIAEEIRNKSLELTEDSDQFFNADSDLLLDTASFDFFLTKNNSNSRNPVRDLRAESLYVKFDPLVSNVNMLPQGPPQVVDGEENAKNSIPQLTLDTPKRNPALAAIDRLLFYSPATGTPNKVETPVKIEEKVVEDLIPKAVPIVDETMAKELELVRSTVLQLDLQLEKQKKEHEEELGKQRLKYKQLEVELSQEVQKKNEMTMVMDEYEKSLSRQMADRERERASFELERAKLQEELQAANHHLGNTEAAFNDVHSKYERLKNVVSAYRSNEDVLKESVHENVETIKTLEARYEQLKSHAMSQLEKANLELEAIRKQHETETVRLQAMIRKAELKSNSLAEMVEQKSKENKELAEILDEVIARVGRHPE